MIFTFVHICSSGIDDRKSSSMFAYSSTGNGSKSSLIMLSKSSSGKVSTLEEVSVHFDGSSDPAAEGEPRILQIPR